MKILVIEDDANITSNTGQYFEDNGHELEFAYSGIQGLDLALGQLFDLIILDLAFDEHIYSARKHQAVARDFAGGGCGCN